MLFNIPTMSDTNTQSTVRTRSTLMFHLFALFTVSVWGASFVATSVLLEHGLHAVEIYIYRFIIAYLLILIFTHSRLWANNLRDEALLALCGITSGSIYFIAENTALQYTTTTNVGLLTCISPLMTTLLIGYFYKSERPNKGVYLGSLLALLGVGCVIFNEGFQLNIMPYGDMLALLAALSFAFYSIILRKVNVVYDALFITRKTFFYGIVTALPFLAMEPEICSFSVFTELPVLLNLLFLGAFCSLLGFFLWAKVNDKLGAIKANNYLYFQPVVTLILSYFILSERISIIGYLGCVLILLGLYASDKMATKR